MFDLGGGELLLILVAVLLLFGPKKLPELAQGLGKGLRQFRKAQQDFSEQINTAFYEEQRKDNIRKAPPAAENTIARNSTSVSLPTGSPGPGSSDQEKSELAPAEDEKGMEEPENSIAPPVPPQREINKGKEDEQAS